jgi:hypothetical protein
VNLSSNETTSVLFSLLAISKALYWLPYYSIEIDKDFLTETPTPAIKGKKNFKRRRMRKKKHEVQTLTTTIHTWNTWIYAVGAAGDIKSPGGSEWK